MHQEPSKVGKRKTHVAVLSRRVREYRAFTDRDLDAVVPVRTMSDAERLGIRAVAAVLPCRVNSYIVEDLIDWSMVPDDPIYQLTFPQPAMLAPADFSRMYALLRRRAPEPEIEEAAQEVRRRMVGKSPVEQAKGGAPPAAGPRCCFEHKYRETVLFFAAGRHTRHAYSTFFFSGPAFRDGEEPSAEREVGELARHLGRHHEVADVLLTGGDPLALRTDALRRCVEPLLEPALGHIESIRFDSHAPAHWPHRFTTDADADDLLRLFETIRRSGRNVTLISHYSHSRELETAEARRALRRIQGAGAVVRCAAPIVRRVNDSAAAWVDLWRRQVRLGAVPYYMFVESNGGPRRHFEVPLARGLAIYSDAYSRVSGLARTVRGPVMPTRFGKLLVAGRATLGGEEAFILKFVQALDPAWVGRTFFARFDERATGLHDLRPAFGESRFFFEDEPSPTGPDLFARSQA